MGLTLYWEEKEKEEEEEEEEEKEEEEENEELTESITFSRESWPLST